MRNGGNGEHSRWSQELHANLGSNVIPCPVDGGCGGDCRKVHPRGIVVDAADRWYPLPFMPEGGEDR